MRKNHDPRCESYIESVRLAIERDYQQVPAEWEMQLTQLKDMYLMYLRASDAMKKENMVITTNGGKTTAMNPNFKIMSESIERCDKIVKSFGLSPLAKSKIGKSVDVDDTDLLNDF